MDPPADRKLDVRARLGSLEGIDGQPDVAMDVVVDFPEYPEEGTPAVSYPIRISGTGPTPLGRCAR